MVLNKDKHKVHLIKILTQIYEDPFLAKNLAFKGGTAAYLFYNLDRFSTDLDFDILFDPETKKKDIQRIYKGITSIIRQHGYKINDTCQKHYTLYWEISYEKNTTNIKIEISKRFNKNILPKTKKHLLYGTNIQVVRIGYLIAQKLIATLYRTKPANRDIYDINYYLSSKYSTKINYKYIEKYTELDIKEFFKKLDNFLKNKDNHKILDGLGEVIPEGKKDFVREKMIEETRNLLKMHLDTL